jgi:hypothetical protein
MVTDQQFFRFHGMKSRSGSLNDKALWHGGMSYAKGIVCPVNDGHNRGTGVRVNPILHVLFHKRPLCDVMWSVMGDCLIQPHVARALADNGITGYELRPARTSYLLKANTLEVDDRAPAPPPFQELVVRGWGGKPVDTEQWVECEVCGLTRCTLPGSAATLVDPNQWDGSDVFFTWPLVQYYLVTEKFARVMRENGFTGFRLTPIEELDVYDYGDPVTVGKLSDLLPKERADEISRQLGSLWIEPGTHRDSDTQHDALE